MMKRHEVDYVQENLRNRKVLISDDIQNPNDIVKIRVKQGGVRVRYAGVYAKGSIEENFSRYLEAPSVDHYHQDFYSVGWYYDTSEEA